LWRSKANLISLFLAGFFLAMATVQLRADGTATVSDSFAAYESDIILKGEKVDIFFISEVDGKRVQNAWTRTTMANVEPAFAMRQVEHQHRLPAKPLRVRLEGRVFNGKLMGYVFNPSYKVSGVVAFTPVAGKRYVVRGVLRKKGSAVWIETTGGQIVTKKVVGK
jgi:hypothetical protein